MAVWIPALRLAQAAPRADCRSATIGITEASLAALTALVLAAYALALALAT